MATASPLRNRVLALTQSRRPGFGRAAARRGEFHWHEADESQTRQFDEKLATFLGVFSIGLGLAEVIAPKEFCRFIGLRGDKTDRTVARLFGLRELAAGIGILASPRRPAAWVWSRVAGDAMDLAALGAAMASGPPEPGRTAAATASVVGVTLLDIYDAARLSGYTDRANTLSEAHKAITIGKSPAELYSFWRNYENLPKFMSHLQSVQDLGGNRSHWRTHAPLIGSIEWDAETTEDVPNERIAWRSLPGSSVATEGSVRFVPAPGNRGTEVHVHLIYDPPAGPLGAAIAKMMGQAPDQQLQDELRIFKQLMETGLVVISDSGTGANVAQHPAHPPSTP